ncbi:response regulator [Methylosarcina fibrata]|uniref:response regulator n=1 Tax=Methylosarcina fibrata TaxID=105972 RepID=UPI000370F6D6|nr:response regulator [Methylosarcina fibrata]
MATFLISKPLKFSFVSSLLVITTVIALIEAVLMFALDALPKSGIILTSLQETLADTALLSLLAAPLIWWLSFRPLALKVSEQQAGYERQANENKQLLQALDIGSLVSITDVTGRIVYVNRRFSEVSGYSESELLGQDHRLINSGYHDQDFFRTLWRTIAEGQPWEGEICNRDSQGGLYWIASSIVPLLGEDGKPRQYIAISRSITKIKENESRLLSLKQALDASSEMILVTDAAGRIQYVNPALCDFTGWKKEKLVGNLPSLLNSPEADRQTLHGMQQCLRQGRTWSGRLLNRRKGPPPFNIDGQTTPPDARDFWADICITPICNKEGALIGYVQIQHDVTDQVLKEQAQILENTDTAARLAISEALQQTRPLQQRFTQVLDILFNLKAFDLQRKGGIFLKDPDHDVLEMYLLHGKFSEEFIRRERRIPYGACLCGRAALAQELIVSDDCFCDPRHEHRFEDMQAHGHYIVPIVSAGAVLGILFLYTDPYPVKLESRLTMLRQVGDMLALALLQEQARMSLESARYAAEQAAKAKSEFLANMSHEIRTPMNGVLGMLEILKDTEMTREQEDLLKRAAHSAESLLTIINDILDFSKLESGKCELERIEFDLPTLVEEICALMSVRAHAKHLELNCFLPPRLPPRWQGDPNRIRQVLVNLIGNAVKFTEHGEVSVKVIEQEAMGGHRTLRFEVKDTGIGMSPEEQSRLFQPFTQADSSTARRFGGTGLGLSISKTLVGLMDGAIGVESAVGQGTCFWVTLPLAPADDSAPLPLTDLSGKRALIVDDNETNRKILNHYLQHWGMEVSEASNAPDALIELEVAARRGQAYDVLLSDLHMPKVDGYALARAILNDPPIASTPRLLLSSGGMGSEEERLALGFAQTLLKPVRQTQLFDAIARVLQAPVTTAEAPGKVAEELPDYNDKRILVVEDNKVNQKVLLNMLGKFRCRPDLAENGLEALGKMAQKAYDLVFMDCQMPVMDGYEAVRRLRGQELTRSSARIPVIALTAHVSAGEREKCLAAGMDDFMSKPIGRPELTDVLARWLSEPGPTQADSATGSAEAMSGNAPAGCWDEAAALKRLDDDQELLGDMIDLFLNEAPACLIELEEALARGDDAGLADVAHALKGMAGHFCAERLQNEAAALEHRALRGGNGLSELRQTARRVADEANRLLRALSQKQGIPL